MLSTLHTLDAPETVNRIIDFFPPHMHQQARAMLAGTLKAWSPSDWCATWTGAPPGQGGDSALHRRVKDMIMDPDETGRLIEVIAEGEYYGMQTFDQALLGIQAGRVSMDEALSAATSPHDFKLRASGGQRSTSLDQLVSA